MLAVLLATLAGCGDGTPQPISFDPIPSNVVDTSTPDDASPGGTTTTPGAPTPTVPELAPWVDVTGNLAGLPSECGNMSGIFADGRGDLVVAGVALQGLWTNGAGGDQWEQLGQGSDSAEITNRTASVVFDPAAPGTFWQSGNYGGPGAFRTVDGGQTFDQLGEIGHLDGLSVDLSDPERATMLAGTHERAELFRSTDGGRNWTNLEDNLPPNIGFTSQPLVIDSQVHLLGTTQGESAGIFRTTDGGSTWEQVYDSGVFGLPVVSQLDGSIYWMLERGGGLVRSADGGATWTEATGSGTIAETWTFSELPDGRLAAIGDSGVIVSADQGATWQSLGPPFPDVDPFGLTFSGAHNAIYVWSWDCGDAVPAGALQRLDLTPVP